MIHKARSSGPPERLSCIEERDAALLQSLQPEGYIRPRKAEHDLAKSLQGSFAFPIRPPHNGWQQPIVTIKKAGAMCPFQC
jgi:hypothetical protein